MPKKRPIAERFWEKVDKRGPDECWEWKGGRQSMNYGMIGEGNRVRLATHVVWELTRGPVPKGMLIRHLVCDNPPCVNPAHLAIGTQKDNMADRRAKLRYSGEKNHTSKLTDAAVRDIRARVAAGESCASVAREYGVTSQAAGCARRGKTWSHVA